MGGLQGHCLIAPHRVYSDYFDSTEDEVVGLQKLIIETKKLLDKKFQPKGYNVGINCGEVAGQTVPHVHIHLIPRYKGDMDNPRGGVRGYGLRSLLLQPCGGRYLPGLHPRVASKIPVGTCKPFNNRFLI